jgi:GT2 family glycosyltransferase
MNSLNISDAKGVTAVVVTHNRPEELKMVVAALVGQTMRPGRILIIDNASPIPAADVLADFVGVDVIRSEINTGGAGGFAFALQQALNVGGQWIWLMDDDAVPRPDALSVLLSAIPNLPSDAGALCCTVYEFGKIATRHRRLFQSFTGLERSLPDSAYSAQSQKIDTGSFVGFMVRAEAANQVGLPDATFFIAYDDTEYSLRLNRAGWSVWLVPKSGIDHLRTVQSKLSTSEFGFKHYYNIRNRLVVVRKYATCKILAGLVAVVYGALIWLGSRRSLRPQAWRQFQRAVHDGWRGLLGKVS